MSRHSSGAVSGCSSEDIADYGPLMRLTDQKFLPRENETALKINISRHNFYPILHDTVAARPGDFDTAG
jgi:hypothetical protein